MRTLIFIFIIVISSIFCYSCLPKPKIELSNTLEIALDNNNEHRNYVKLLNKTLNGDDAALVNFLKIDYIHDAAGYDHGYVLSQVMKKIGDEKFSKGLDKLTKQDKITVKDYFIADIQGDDSIIDNYIKNYPKTFKQLNIK